MAFQEEMLSKVLSNAGRGIRKKKQKKMIWKSCADLKRQDLFAGKALMLICW